MLHSIHIFFTRRPAWSFMSLAFVFALVEGAFSFCSPKECPAFADTYFNAWFPYQQGQTAYYKTAGMQRDSLYDLQVTKTEARSVGGGFSPTYCNIYAFIQSRNIEPGASFLYLNYDLGDGSVSRNLALSINNFLVDGSEINDLGIVINPINHPVQSAYFNSLVLDGKPYTSVQVIQKDTTVFKEPGVYKIWLAKNTGLIAYEEYPSQVRWIKE